MTELAYPIGTRGTPWGEQEKRQWLAAQSVKRSYRQEVLDKLQDLPQALQCVQYGALPYDSDRYPLYALQTKNWKDTKPAILITGGVHGYETSGVQGALRFALRYAADYQANFNFVIAFCVSPWGYETINRWNPLTLDPNRSFFNSSGAPEAECLMQYVQSLDLNYLAHFDLHETTDTDNSEFRPALSARDGIEQAVWDIPDGFYTVGDSTKPASEFQTAIIESVAKVTHIAPADEQGRIIGEKIAQRGVINYPKSSLGLCGGFSGATYVTTTEVYPDSDKVDAENCIEAQIAAVAGGLSFLRS